jgi:hypothetical protein
MEMAKHSCKGNWRRVRTKPKSCCFELHRLRGGVVRLPLNSPEVTSTSTALGCIRFTIMRVPLQNPFCRVHVTRQYNWGARLQRQVRRRNTGRLEGVEVFDVHLERFVFRLLPQRCPPRRSAASRPPSWRGCHYSAWPLTCCGTPEWRIWRRARAFHVP